MPSSRIRPSVGSYRRVISLTMVVFPWPFSPIRAIRSPGLNAQIEIVEDHRRTSGIRERYAVEDKSARESGGVRESRWVLIAPGLDPEELHQIGQEQGLVGDATRTSRRSFGCCCWRR